VPLPANAAFKLPADLAREPVLLEATRIAGLHDALLARVLGMGKSAIRHWRAGRVPIPVRRQHLIIGILERIVGEPDPIEMDHTIAKRAALVRDTVLELLEMARAEIPPPEPGQRNVLEPEVYRMLNRLGLRRPDPLAPFEPIGDLRDG
jgi:hypothetical protein